MTTASLREIKKRKNNSHKVGQVIKGPLVEKYGTIGPVNAIVTIIIFFHYLGPSASHLYIYPFSIRLPCAKSASGELSQRGFIGEI